MNSLTDKQIDELIEYLQGSCKSLDEGVFACFDLDNTDIITQEQHSQIENVIFTCECCGWWCEAGDYADFENHTYNGDICSDCGEE